jgi:hypothetical protein
VAYWHRAFGSPSLSIFVKALTKGFIHGIPLLTPKLVSKYPPLSLSTSFGHLNTLRKGISSTRKTVYPSCLGPVASLIVLPRVSPRLVHLQSSFHSSSSRSSTVSRCEWSAADLTGRFPIPSHLGYKYILLFIHLNYIPFVPLKSRTSASYATAYRSASKFFSSLSHPLIHIQIDNEISADLTAFFQAAQPTIYYRANKAERSIRTGKNHFLFVLSSAHITFPHDRWCDLLPSPN